MRVNSNVSGDMSQASEYTSAEVVVALVAYLDERKGFVSFDDIRANVEGLAGSAKGEVHQACFDAGYTLVLP